MTQQRSIFLEEQEAKRICITIAICAAHSILDLEPRLRWGTIPVNGQTVGNLWKNDLLRPFLRRASVLQVQSSSYRFEPPGCCTHPPCFFSQGDSQGRGLPVPVVAHWFCWARGDCCCTMWQIALSLWDKTYVFHWSHTVHVDALYLILNSLFSLSSVDFYKMNPTNINEFLKHFLSFVQGASLSLTFVDI